MGRCVITCASIYGSSRKYADELGRRLGLPVLPAGAPECSAADIVVHFGGLYAGTMLGLKKTACALGHSSLLVAVTVGIADPSVPSNADKIRDDVMKAVPEEVRSRMSVFHLRGALDYSRMTFRHRAMMWMLCRYIKSKDHRTDEDEAVLESYGDSADFIDLSSLESAESFIRSVLEKDG